MFSVFLHILFHAVLRRFTSSGPLFVSLARPNYLCIYGMSLFRFGVCCRFAGGFVAVAAEHEKRNLPGEWQLNKQWKSMTRDLEQRWQQSKTSTMLVMCRGEVDGANWRRLSSTNWMTNDVDLMMPPRRKCGTLIGKSKRLT